MKEWCSIGIGTFMCVVIFGQPIGVHAHSIDLEYFGMEEVYPDERIGRVVADDRRSEGRTYFSFPEWYIVYSAQEYAAFVNNGGHPSDFPYIDAMVQFWQSVDGVERATEGKYEINEETRTVINTIGVSFTAEYIITALYESTIGRVTKILNASRKSPEDIYSDKVAREYGEFLNQVPWYEFPYFEKLKGLWTEAYGFNSISIRGIERRAVLSAGYIFKGTYAAVIRKLTQSSFDTAEDKTTFIIAGVSRSDVDEMPGVMIIEEGEDGALVVEAIRYRAFSDAAVRLIDAGAEFISIENNTSILVSAVAPEASECMDSAGHVIFRMPILTDIVQERAVFSTPVPALHVLVQEISECGTDVEHIYDY